MMVIECRDDGDCSDVVLPLRRLLLFYATACHLRHANILLNNLL